MVGIDPGTKKRFAKRLRRLVGLLRRLGVVESAGGLIDTADRAAVA